MVIDIFDYILGIAKKLYSIVLYITKKNYFDD